MYPQFVIIQNLAQLLFSYLPEKEFLKMSGTRIEPVSPPWKGGMITTTLTARDLIFTLKVSWYTSFVVVVKFINAQLQRDIS